MTSIEELPASVLGEGDPERERAQRRVQESRNRGDATPGTGWRPLRAADVRSTRFSPSADGVDPTEVAAFVGRVASALEASAAVVAGLQAEIAALEAAAANGAVDDAAAGRETARVLLSAQAAARAIRRAAETEAAALQRRTEEERTVALGRPDPRESAWAKAVEIAAAETRRAADAYAEQVRQGARAEADRIRRAADEDARRLVKHAVDERLRLLSDLSRDTKDEQQRIASLRDERRRLADACRTLSEMADELAGAYRPDAVVASITRAASRG